VAAALAAGPAAWAQAPPSPEATEIAACLCLQQAMDASRADMSGGQQAYMAAQSELAQIDAQLQGERARMDVNNPQAVAQFRQLLERRDTVFRRSTGLASGDLHNATERYNARVNEFNVRCANHPRNPDLLRAVQATLACPPPY
jgi:hypothetical protein